ncbi:MAG TPA: carboxypeptidase regulatory-like domain-containing protein [Vicinamibacterales bacterium]|nr:carboxypeptidase regulatory-like domain-containing protein [Vicinamibacterales bacterium]
MRSSLFAVILALAVAIGAAAAQTPPPPAAQPPAKPAAKKPTASTQAGARGSITFFVTNQQGKGIPDATVAMTGPTPREGATNKDGVVRLQNVRTGSYRVRVEAPEFITLERDITMKNGLEVEMTLNPAPEPPEAATPPAPPPTDLSRPSAAIAPDPSATIELSSVVEFFSKNQLPRNQPRSESVVGQAGEATSSLLQVRNTIEGRSHAAADEVLYVINGKAEVNSRGRIYPVETGSLILIPRGVTYSVANRGRDPLWALSVLAGQAEESAEGSK